jgi:predicted HAD superfamily Cof-like phosphohydrolase
MAKPTRPSCEDLVAGARDFYEGSTDDGRLAAYAFDAGRAFERRAGGIDSLVRDFHEAMGIPVAGTLSVPSDERVRLRARLITEEYFETMAALFGANPFLEAAKDAVFEEINHEDVKVDLVELDDGLCDLDYVVAGTRLEFGIDGAAVLAEVHRSNVSKVGAPTRADGKILKGPNYSPPDIAGVLERQRRNG